MYSVSTVFRMIMKILKKEWFTWTFWKRGVVEKRGDEETKSMPHAPVRLCIMYGQLILSGKPFNTFSMARLKYCNCPFPIPPRILLYKSLLPRMACIFFLSESLTIFPPWSVIGMGYLFFILVTLHLCLLLIHRYLWNSQKW